MYKKFFTVLSISFCISNIYAAIYEIGAANFKIFKHADSPQKSFGLNNKNIQIKTPRSSIMTAWIGNKIQPSANFITFKAKSLQNKNVTFKANIRMHATHASDYDKCNGSAKDKFFALKNYARAAENEFHIPLTINAGDLRCRQCGNIVDHAHFIFDFETENDGGIEITPFTMRASFNIFIQRAKDTKSPYISNILSPDFKPYEMKKLPEHNMYADDILVMSQRANPMKIQYKSFLPILELWQKKDYKNAVLQAEKIANNNTFCSIFLYLLYSRGYENYKIDYQKAARYLNNFIGSTVNKEPGFMFYFDEYKKIWKKNRLIPTCPNEKATVKAWGRNYAVMDEIIPLRGKYPLKNCYEENMRNIGGIGARTLYLISREQVALNEIHEHARRLGNAEACTNDYAPYVDQKTPLAKESINKPSDSEFKNLKKAAELGFIPAKLKLARVLLTKNFAPGGFDFITARKLLAESIKELEKYSKTPCTHAVKDLQYARELLTVIPAADISSAELVKLHYALQQEKANGTNIGFADFKINIVAEMLAAKNDNPESLLQQALKLPDSQHKKKNEMIRSAAKKGSRQAIQMCLMNIVPRNDREYWHFLYLAGKYKLPYNGYQQNYFNESYQILQQQRFQMPPNEYFKAVSTLAPHHAQAKAEFKILSVKLEFDITISPNGSLKAEHVNQGGRHSIVINAKPSNEARYITVKNKSSEKMQGSIFFFSRSQECSNLSVYGEFKDEHGRIQKTYPGNSVPMKFIPAELKIYIAPRKTPLELQLAIMIR